MNQLLETRLRPGEKIVWQGHPAGIRLCDPAFLLKNLIVWGFAATFAVAAVWYTAFYAPAAGISFFFAFVVGAALLTLSGYIAATPFVSRIILEQNVCYCMTTERMIAYSVQGKQVRFQSRDFIDFAEASIEPLSSGKANLYLGPKTCTARLELLSALLTGHRGEQLLPLTFASIVDIGGACRCLPAYIPIEGYVQQVIFNRAAA